MANYNARFAKNGNVKIGKMWSFNKLAGSGVICGCKGTCGKHCVGCYNPEDPGSSNCYVFKRYRMYTFDTNKNAVLFSHIRNTNAVRNDMNNAFKELNTQVRRARKKPVALRVHSSGEIESLEELKKWNELANNNPGIPVYVYSKAYEIIEEFVKDVKELADNFFINISIWHEEGVDCYNKLKNIKNIRAFVYCDGYDYSNRITIDCMCPAYNENGKMNHNITCDKCRICYRNDRKVCGCHDH